MYPISLVLLCGLGIAIERYVFIRTVASSNRHIWKIVQPMLKSGEMENALTFAGESNTAIGKIITYGLTRSSHTRRSSDVQLAMDEALLEAIAKLRKRSDYLVTFAKLAILLGTVFGLSDVFSTYVNVSETDKMSVLSKNVSATLSTVAYGLMVSIPLLFIDALIKSKTEEVSASLKMVSLRVLNLVTERMSRLLAERP